MDPYRNEHDGGEDFYPCRDYYTTGGSYRPVRPRKNHGWILAVLGVVLLCVSGVGAVFRGRTESSVSPVDTAVVEQAAAAETTPGVEPGMQMITDTSDLLGTGAQLVISKSSGRELSFQDIYKKVIPSVVSITAIGDDSTATGTGIVMSEDGYIITNYHVVSDARAVSVLLTDGQEFYAAAVGGDETSDIMVLKIEASNLTPAEFGNSDTAQVGDTVVAIGDPLGQELRGTMTNGIICGIQRDISVEDRTMTLMQTNAALNSGNSGGPLVNMEGQVIGINTMKITSNYTAVEGIGFAIPISSAKTIVDELVEKGYVAGRPAFGFTVEVLDPRIAVYFELPGRLCIQSVEIRSDAYEKGIRQGDIITAIEGVAVSTADEFNLVKNNYVAGDELMLTVFRSGNTYEVPVKLMDRAELN